MSNLLKRQNLKKLNKKMNGEIKVFRHCMGIFRPALFGLVLSVFVCTTSVSSIVKVAVISSKMY